MTYDIIAKSMNRKQRTLTSQRHSKPRAIACADELCARGYDVEVKDANGLVVYTKLARLTLIS